MGASIFRFSLVFLASSIAVPVALYAIKAAFQIDLSNSFVPFIPFLAGATYEGQKYVQNFGAMPNGGEMWFAALIMGIIGTLIGLGLSAVAFLAIPGWAEAIAGIPPSFMLVGIGIMLVLAILMCRIFVWSGARGAFKKLQRTSG